MKYFLLIISLLILPFTLFASQGDLTKSKGTTQDVIVQLMPSPAQEDVSRYTKIEASFNIPLDAKHVKKFDVKLKCLSCKKKKNIKGTVGYVEADEKVTFTPAESLTPGVYEVEFKSLKADKVHKKTKIKEIKYRFVVVEEVLERLTVAPATVNLIEGETVQLTVTGKYDNGIEKKMMSQVAWIVGDSQTISVDDNGLVSALKAGNTSIKAKLTGVVEAGEVVSNDVPVEVLIPDVIPPVITLNGDANITLNQDESYEELGATAVDDRDGDVNVTISGSVDTSIEGIYTITYVATDNAENKAMATRTVNVKNNEPILKSLVLSADQTHFVRTKDTFYNDYLPVRAPIKVMATYSDEHSEEVTDRVEWLDLQGKIAMGTDYFRAERGTYTLRASLQGIESNEITIDVEDDTSLVMHEISYRENFSSISIAVTLLNKPTDEVSLTLNLKAEDKVGFQIGFESKQSYTLTFKPERWGENSPDIQYVTVKVLDTTMSSPIVVITEPMVSADPNYGNKNPRDIEISRRPELILDAPSLDERKGAIRGVPIKFRVTTREQDWTKVTLIDPPKGMRVLKPTFIENTELYGIDVQWDVPMDAKEGEIYKITAKATDPIGREKTITFPIKVPKTTPIQTKIENNELIVKDKNSPLYGMKMKGHNGEDVSALRLRSVVYEDVWEQYVENKAPEDVVEHIVFVIDNMPEALDVKMPDYMDSVEEAVLLDVEIYKYTESILIGEDFWNYATMTGYVYENTNGFVLYHKVNGKYSSDGSNIFMIVIAKMQNKEK